MNTLMSTPPGNKTIGVMGSGLDEQVDLAEPIGRLLATLNVNLLTGAGGGVMTSVSRAYTSSPREYGLCIGVVPCIDKDHPEIPKNGYPNEFVELPVFTHLPYSGKKGQDDLSRNHINILSSTALIALPGGDGTASEVELAVTYQKPIMAFASSESRLINFHRDVERAFDIADVEAFLMKHLHRKDTK
jgi:uncharacterized protein (TIGR00725 family)